VLAFGGAVADFATPMEADGAFQRVMGLAFVQPDLGAAFQIGVGLASGKKKAPGWVKVALRLVRVKSRAPSSPSRELIC
jgi:hypothetical protein